MSRIKNKFEKLGKNALVCYLTPDFPMAGCTESIVPALEKAGADLIEIGIPFSDPLADGPMVQSSSHRVLQSGITFQRILTIIETIRKQSDIPIIAMGYANTAVNMGIDIYFKRLQKAGIDGVILPDVPLEEMDRFLPAAAACHIDLIPLVSPLSSDTRIRAVSAKTSGFIYCVSITGVTGMRTGNYFSEDLTAFLLRVRENSTLPALVGFGISEHEHLRFLEDKCDGYIVGSALLKAIMAAHTVEESVQEAVSFVENLLRSKV
jgi:tryptophan synthase alpha chain